MAFYVSGTTFDAGLSARSPTRAGIGATKVGAIIVAFLLAEESTVGGHSPIVSPQFWPILE